MCGSRPPGKSASIRRARSCNTGWAIGRSSLAGQRSGSKSSMMTSARGERQKAARGELRLPLPAGLAYARDGPVVRNPDEEVQARLLLLFAKFGELRSAKSVMRYFQRSGLQLPVRPLRGPAPHEVVWRP